MFVKIAKLGIAGGALAMIAGCVPIPPTETPPTASPAAVQAPVAQRVYAPAPVAAPVAAPAPSTQNVQAPPAEAPPTAAQLILIEQRESESDNDGDEDGGWGG